ncbi:hypothetical protein, partial [Streptococcus pneumoniae]|uniref:hypothetical protein n=1 Tax=Streptococcus pneumoniae TaxID=1313 RepID=UPI001E5748A6
ICISTSDNTPPPTITVGMGLGEFYLDLTQLTDNTTYYIRAYATNSEDTSYGETITIKTLPALWKLDDIDFEDYGVYVNKSSGVLD